MNRLGIVVPVYNEGEQLVPWLKEVASYLKDGDHLVIVDASDVHSKLLSSKDSNASAVLNALKNYIDTDTSLHYLMSEKTRSLQMNVGTQYLLDSGNTPPDLLWFLHSDSGLSVAHLDYLRALKPNIGWGRFDVSLMADTQVNAAEFLPAAGFLISKLINIRSRLTQVMTGDQGIFVRSEIFLKLGGYAPISLMEDIELSKRLRNISKADCKGPVLKASARRWQKQGWIKTVLLMWKLRFMYWFGTSPDTLVEKYYGK